MNTRRFLGLKVITDFHYRGARIYIRSRARFFEQLIVHKGKLYTHYFEAPAETAGRPLSQEEEMNMTATVMEIARATVDDIILQRSLITKIKTNTHVSKILTKAAELHSQWFGKDEEPKEADPRTPHIDLPHEASRYKAQGQ